MNGTPCKTFALAGMALLACYCLPQGSVSDAAAEGTDKPADNTLCFVCHVTLKEETITTSHAAKGIGCIKCHGASGEHAQDEMQMTTPDRLWGRRQVDGMCRDCHDAPHEGVEARVKAPARGNLAPREGFAARSARRGFQAR